MVNIGRPSSGCHMCRKRKVKCDEAKPGCVRCAKISKPCPGYRSQSDSLIPQFSAQQLSPVRGYAPLRRPSPLPQVAELVWNDVLHDLSSQDSDDSEAWTQMPAQYSNERSISPLPPIYSPPLYAQPVLHPQDARHPSLPPSLPYDVEHRALCYWLNLFVYDARSIYRLNNLDFMPMLLKTAAPNSCLPKTVAVIANMFYGIRMGSSELCRFAEDNYPSAIAAVAQAVQDPQERLRDETITAAWLLGHYELITAIFKERTENLSMSSGNAALASHLFHTRGALTLLALVDESQSYTATRSKVCSVINESTAWRFFILNQDLPTSTTNHQQPLYQTHSRPTPLGTKLTVFFGHVARLRQRIDYLVDARTTSLSLPHDTTPLTEALSAGEALDADFKSWNAHDPDWQPHHIHPTRLSQSGSKWIETPRHALYYFSDAWNYIHWLRYCLARIKLYESLIAAAKSTTEWQRSTFGGTASRSPDLVLEIQIRSYETIVQMTLSSILGSTAYALGDVDEQGEVVRGRRCWSHAFGGDGFTHGNEGNWGVEEQREMNASAAFQLFVPLKMMQHSPHLTESQAEGVGIALGRVADAFVGQ